MMTLKGFRSTCSVWVLVSVLGAMLVGCAGSGGSSTFYILRSMEGSQESLSTTAGESRVSVLVGPITLPGYLDRNQMVTVAGKNEMVLDEFNRWAESLQDSFYRVLLEDFSILLNTPEVYRYDQGGSSSADYQVVIDVTRFDVVPQGDAVLTAFWTLTGKDADTPGVTRKSVFRAPVSATGFSGIVDAQNQTLTEFSREIAEAIQSSQP
ncbi:MAG: membrane integrity-associated transporter subunit PqiC [Deltaproteobacteria bacterium]|nr:membrane integrity-associated transporter subunit PqiC [Deltaproteobacteria bacterium]